MLISNLRQGNYFLWNLLFGTHWGRERLAAGEFWHSAARLGSAEPGNALPLPGATRSEHTTSCRNALPSDTGIPAPSIYCLTGGFSATEIGKVYSKALKRNHSARQSCPPPGA